MHTNIVERHQGWEVRKPAQASAMPLEQPACGAALESAVDHHDGALGRIGDLSAFIREGLPDGTFAGHRVAMHESPETNHHKVLYDRSIAGPDPRAVATDQASCPALPTPSLAALETAAFAAYYKQEYEGCISTCKMLVVLQPAESRYHLLIGAAYFHLGDYERSLKSTWAAVEHSVGAASAEAYSNIANVYKVTGNLSAAQGFYERAITLKPGFADAHGNLATVHLQLGNNDEAITHYREALRLKPRNASWMVDLGHLLRVQGNDAEAKRLFQDAIAVEPTLAIAWSNLGCICKDERDLDAAVRNFQKAIELDPHCVNSYSHLGNVFKDLGMIHEAEAIYVRGLAIRPDCATIMGNLATVQLELGKIELALESFHGALALKPDFPDCLSNLGNALKMLGRMHEALEAYHRCLELTNWTHCDGLNNAANAYKELGDAVTAEKLYRKAIALRPNFAGARSNLGNLLKEQFKLHEALSQYEAALAAEPRFADAWSNMGNCLKDLGRFDDAIRAYQEAITIRPAFADAYGNLASVYKDTGVLDKAIQFYRTCLSLKGGQLDPIPFCNLVHCLQTVCDWSARDEVFANVRAVIAKQMQEGRVPAVQPHHALVYPLPAEQQLQLAAHYAHAAHRSVATMGLSPYEWPIKLVAARLSEKRRLRVGYVSSDFGNHPLSHLMQHVFVWHDPGTFEIFCYATSGDDGSKWRKAIQRGVKHFRETQHLPHEDLAKLIHDDQIDVLVNLNGYTKGSRNEVFALRPAPIQVMYLGFPGSSGAAYMDYFITDPVTTPPELGRLFSERLAYMPHCYFVNDHMQSYLDCAADLSEDGINWTRLSYGLPARPAIVFCMHNQLYKIDPDIFKVWMRILQAVPGSVLWLLQFPATGEPNIRAEARRLGISAERLVFSPIADKVDHLKRGRVADLFLDTPLCNAHTTGTDILWGGVPILTLPGATLASRVAGALVHAAGCPELVAHDLAEYERIAVALGTDVTKLRALQAKVRAARWTQPLFDTHRWVADWQRLLIAMKADFLSLCSQGVDPHLIATQRAQAAFDSGDADACAPGAVGCTLGRFPVRIDPTTVPMFDVIAPVLLDGPASPAHHWGRPGPALSDWRKGARADWGFAASSTAPPSGSTKGRRRDGDC